MRRGKKRSAAAPYALGIALGLVAVIITSALGAAIIALGGSASFAVIISIAAIAIGSFVSGRTAGALKQSGGIKTGALCGLMLFAPLILLSIVFGQLGGVLVWVKAALCIAFGATGGVVGVNSSYS